MSRKNKRRSADFDITPLLDVTFMLIIFFVLTASFIQGNISVALPSGEGASTETKGSVTVTIDEGGGVLWNGKSVSGDELRVLARAAKGEVLVAGDKKASYGTVAEVLSLLREEDVTSAGLLMQGK